MNVFFEESGSFKAGSVLSRQGDAFQVELPGGRRAKVRAKDVLIEFEKPTAAELMQQADALAQEIDLDFLWECAPDDEFPFATLGAEYFGASFGAIERAALVLRMPHAGLIAAFEACPLIAILRGVTPADAADHGQALYEAGFRIVEVPLNSPQPFDSISAIRKVLPADAIVGAGTVLHPLFVDDVKAAGGELIVMPHSDPEVVIAAKARGLACAPGVATPTEAFIALKNGADVLKMFPAEQLGCQVVKACRSGSPLSRCAKTRATCCSGSHRTSRFSICRQAAHSASSTSSPV